MKVILSTEMACLISDMLFEQYNIPKKSLFDSTYREFDSEDLAKIQYLELINFTSIADLVHFPNLKKLYIRGKSYNDILPEFDVAESPILNHITNFTPLSSLTSLEELTIENDLNIEELDLSNLKQLNTLIVVNNPVLKEVKGLDDLEHLSFVLMYGNAITTTIDIEKYAYNTRLTDTNILDMSMYLPMIDYSRAGAKKLKDLEIAGNSKVKFAEKSGFLDFTKVNPQNLSDMFIKLDTMFKRSNAYSLRDEEKVSYVFTYLLKNINFSKASIEKRDMDYTNALAKYETIPKQLIPSLASIHSGYRTYYFKSGNCEGFVNLMVFMLRMLGIEAYDVHCHDMRSLASFGSNHAIVRVHINGKIYYCDPTFDRKNAFNYLLVDYETISRYHQLDSFEHQLNLKQKRVGMYAI